MRTPLVRAGALVLACGLLASACGGDDSGGSSGSDKGDIKVAIITPSSGALAIYGTAAAQAWDYAVKEVNDAGGIDGRKVDLIKKDTDGSPDKTIAAAREAATKDGAHFLGGIVTSSEYLALDPQLQGLNALALSTGKAAALTGESCTKNFFRFVASDQMELNGVAASLDQIPGDKFAILAVDETIGHSGADIFKKAAEDAGKEIVYEGYPPRGTTEFGTYITKIQDSGADALFTMEQGADAVAFTNQAAQFKLLDQFQSVLGIDVVTPPLFDALGDNVVGNFTNLAYDVKLDDPVNQKFVEGMTKLSGGTPFFVQASNYTAATMLFAAIKAAGSSDTDKVRDALEGLKLDTPYGQAEMRAEDHQILVPVNVAKVVKDSSGEGYEVVASTDASTTTPEPDPACKM